MARVVAFCAVTGATRILGPSRNWSSMPAHRASAGNSYASGRIVGTPRALTLRPSSRRYGLRVARSRTYFSRVACVASPYDQTSLKPHEPCAGLHVSSSGSDGPCRQPCVRKTGEKQPNWYQRTMSSRMYAPLLSCVSPQP